MSELICRFCRQPEEEHLRYGDNFICKWIMSTNCTYPALPQFVPASEECNTLRSSINLNQRVWDLLRYQRSDLLDANLITLDEYDNLADDHSAVARLESYDAMREREQSLRRELWLSHGHTGIYGDDGEMQCGECGIDYKRDSVESIIQRRNDNGLRKLFTPTEQKPAP